VLHERRSEAVISSFVVDLHLVIGHFCTRILLVEGIHPPVEAVQLQHPLSNERWWMPR